MWFGLAFAASVPVATVDLAPGTLVDASHLRWVDLSDALARDALLDPVGRLVVERVLAGETLRAERLLDVSRPERFSPPGHRALRVPLAVAPPTTEPRQADLWFMGEAHCVLAANTWVVGFGRTLDGLVDSAWVLVPAEQALAIVRRGSPVAILPPDPKATPCF